jgi:dienelactone hydrolase
MNLVDSTREDPFLANGDKRELLVRFWYPTLSGHDCQRAEYTLPPVWSYFSQLVRVPLPNDATNSCLNAPITGGTHPVIVFTPGYTSTFTDYTFLFEDLASRGYIVAAVDHTYEATAVQFPDGRVVKSILGSHLGNTWRLDNKALSFSLSVRMEDLKFVVDELERVNSELDSPFNGKLNMSRVALAGHSFGGLTTILGVEQDPRFKAGIVIDGVVSNSLAVGPTEMPVLLLAAGREQWSDVERLLWGQLQGPRLAVNLLLRRPTLVIEPHHRPAVGLQVRHHEARSREQLPDVELHLGHHPPRLLPTLRLVAEARVSHHRLVARSPHRPRQQFGDARSRTVHITSAFIVQGKFAKFY